MNSQEHIVAVVDSTHGEDSTLDLARQVVARGGRATVVVLVNGANAKNPPLRGGREPHVSRRS